MTTIMGIADTFSEDEEINERYGIPAPLTNHHPQPGEETNSMYFGSFSRAAEEGLKNFQSYVSAQKESLLGPEALLDQPQNSLLSNLPTFDDMKNALAWNNNNGRQDDPQEISTLGTPPQLRQNLQQPQRFHRSPTPAGGGAQYHHGTGQRAKSMDRSGRSRQPPARGRSASRPARSDSRNTRGRSASRTTRGRSASRGRSISRGPPQRGRSMSRGRSMTRGRSASRPGAARSKSRGRSMDRRPIGRGRSLSAGPNGARGRSRSRGPPRRFAGQSRGRKVPGTGFFQQRRAQQPASRKPQKNNRKAQGRKNPPVRKQRNQRDDESRASSGRVSAAMDAIWKRVKPAKRADPNDKRGRNGKPASRNQATRSGGPTKHNTATRKNNQATTKHHPAKTHKKKATTNRRQEHESRSSRETSKSEAHRRQVNNTRHDREEREAPEPSIAERSASRRNDSTPWLANITDSFVTPWSQKKEAPMAAFENDRLGEKQERTRARRLESAHEVVEETNFVPVRPHELDSLTNSVSFELTTVASDASESNTAGTRSLLWSPRMKREYLSRDGRMNAKWSEVQRSANVIARYLLEDEDRASLDSIDDEEFHDALHTFREHARRLNMGEKRLFAYVRDDPTILDASTFDDSTLDDIWMTVGKSIDQRIDSYVDAFENVLQQVQTFNDAHSCAPISVNGDDAGRRRRRANE